MLLIDAANVIGSRPTGWWNDRPKAARDLVEQLVAAVAADLLEAPVVVVLEGRARDGFEAGASGGVEVVHAGGSGDDELVAQAARSDQPVTAVTADRELRRRLEQIGAAVQGPKWLQARL